MRPGEGFAVDVCGGGLASAVEPAVGLVTEIGVDYAQGFHIGRPAPVG
jgi:hypothetical protein